MGSTSSIDDINASPIDHKLEFVKAITYRELNENRAKIVVNLVKEIGWSIGFSHIKPETIEKLMAENKRM